MIALHTRSRCDLCGRPASVEADPDCFLCERCAEPFNSVSSIGPPVGANAVVTVKSSPGPSAATATFSNPVAKATEGKTGTAVVTGHVRRSTTGTGLRVGEADAVRPATSEVMDATVGGDQSGTLAIPACVDMARDFWPFVSKTESCWEWTGSKNSKGYGQLSRRSDRPRYVAHRISYLAHKGAIPDGLLACHDCDNRGCVRPSHLWAGTGDANMADMAVKDRGGVRSEYKKISNADVLVVRQMVADGVSHQAVADKFNVNRTTVGRIVGGSRRAHVAPLNSNSGDVPGCLEPGSHTWGGDNVATAPSGRADESAISPHVAGCPSTNPDATSSLPIMAAPVNSGGASNVQAPPAFSSVDPSPAGVDLEAAVSALENEWARHGIRLGKIPSTPKYVRTFASDAASATASADNSKSVNREA